MPPQFPQLAADNKKSDDYGKQCILNTCVLTYCDFIKIITKYLENIVTYKKCE